MQIGLSTIADHDISHVGDFEFEQWNEICPAKDDWVSEEHELVEIVRCKDDS